MGLLALASDSLYTLDSMPKISRQEVLEIAALARLQLSEAEVGLFQEQLEKILSHFEALSELDTSNILPMRQALAGEAENVLREDEPRPSIPVEDALKNAPKRRDSFFEVPKVIEKG